MTISNRHLARGAVLGLGLAASAASLALTAPAAQAAPACSDAVATVLHRAHDTTGDPAGVAHTAEDAYCDLAG